LLAKEVLDNKDVICTYDLTGLVCLCTCVCVRAYKCVNYAMLRSAELKWL